MARTPHPWLKPAILTGALVPLAAIVLRYQRHLLGANPIAEALNELGLAALIFLVASLACTPLKHVAGWTWPIRVRKLLGLLAFFYGCLHLLTYGLLDQGLDLRAIWTDVFKRKFIFVGMSSLLLMAPLAATSTGGMVKRLGFARWKALHRLAYAAGALGCVHFYWRVKKDATEPLIYAAVLALLFAIRVMAALRARAARPAKAPARAVA